MLRNTMLFAHPVCTLLSLSSQASVFTTISWHTCALVSSSLTTPQASRAFATTALSTAGLIPPTHLLTADDCTFGKPHPEPYLKGAALLSADIKNCLVIEDAPAGIRSGVSAGARVLAVCTSHERSKLEGLGAVAVVRDLSGVEVQWAGDGRMRVVVREG